MTTVIRCASRTFGAWLLVLVVSSLASAQANPPRPYAAQLLTTTTSVTPVSATQVLLTYVATGNGTHVGSYQESGSYVIDLTNFTFAGSATATAADGSTFSFTISGGFTGPTTLAGTAVVTGGTRRFSGATGELAFTGDQTSPINIAAQISGWIQY
jgi:hypothetical protein